MGGGYFPKRFLTEWVLLFLLLIFAEALMADEKSVKKDSLADSASWRSYIFSVVDTNAEGYGDAMQAIVDMETSLTHPDAISETNFESIRYDERGRLSEFRYTEEGESTSVSDLSRDEEGEIAGYPYQIPGASATWLFVHPTEGVAVGTDTGELYEFDEGEGRDENRFGSTVNAGKNSVGVVYAPTDGSLTYEQLRPGQNARWLRLFMEADRSGAAAGGDLFKAQADPFDTTSGERLPENIAVGTEGPSPEGLVIGESLEQAEAELFSGSPGISQFEGRTQDESSFSGLRVHTSVLEKTPALEEAPLRKDRMEEVEVTSSSSFGGVFTSGPIFPRELAGPWGSHPPRGGPQPGPPPPSVPEPPPPPPEPK